MKEVIKFLIGTISTICLIGLIYGSGSMYNNYMEQANEFSDSIFSGVMLMIIFIVFCGVSYMIGDIIMEKIKK